jgi:ABC-2 type transport system ATP-binding protein
MATILEVKNLVKQYDKVVAVDGISFALRQGVCFGLLGPNGAGKTTTIEVIEDVIRPTAGEILYKGAPRRPSFKEEVGIQFQSTALLNFLTVRETLETFQSFFTKTATVEELVRLCRLAEFLDQYNDKISGGQRQRFLLALALVNRPELLFLDEPSSGLDPQGRRNLWDLIQGIKAEGKTIILTTHYMEEAQYLCDEVAIMDYGKIIAQGTPAELIRQYSRGITVVLPRHRFALEADLSDITIRSPNLETVFLNLTGRKLRE